MSRRGPVLTETGDAAINQPRIDPAQRVKPEPETRHDARTELLDQHVGALDQRRQPGERIGRLEVDGDRAFAAVQQHEIGAVGAELRLVCAHLVPDTRPLDLDDVGAGFRQQQSGQRPWQQGAEVENFDAGEREHAGWSKCGTSG